MHGHCVGTSAEEIWGRKHGTGGGRNKNRWRKLHEFRNFFLWGMTWAGYLAHVLRVGHVFLSENLKE